MGVLKCKDCGDESNEDYVADSGMTCLVCGSENVEIIKESEYRADSREETTDDRDK